LWLAKFYPSSKTTRCNYFTPTLLSLKRAIIAMKKDVLKKKIDPDSFDRETILLGTHQTPRN
jgi:hypothetical protein